MTITNCHFFLIELALKGKYYLAPDMCIKFKNHIFTLNIKIKFYFKFIFVNQFLKRYLQNVFMEQLVYHITGYIAQRKNQVNSTELQEIPDRGMGEQIGIILMKPIRVLVVGLIAKSLFLSGLLPLQIITYTLRLFVVVL